MPTAKADVWGVVVKSFFDPDQTLDNARIPLAGHRRTRLSLSGIPWTQISGAVAEGGGRRRRDRLLLRASVLNLVWPCQLS